MYRSGHLKTGYIVVNRVKWLIPVFVLCIPSSCVHRMYLYKAQFKIYIGVRCIKYSGQASRSLLCCMYMYIVFSASTLFTCFPVGMQCLVDMTVVMLQTINIHEI